MEESYHLLVCHGPKAAKHWVITTVTVLRLAHLNSVASAFPVACCGGKRANTEWYYSLRIEDSPRFAAENFNYRKTGVTFLLCS